MANKNVKNKEDHVTRNITLGTVFFVLLFSVFFYVYAGNQKNNVEVPKDAVVAQKSDKAIVLNSELKGVPTLDIWEDLQCPVCKKFEEVTGPTLSTMINEKKVVAKFHIVSFIGAESVLLANTAACASDEGKFKDMHDFLYKNQAAKENSGFWNADKLVAAGEAIGITSKDFKTCVTSNKYQKYTEFVMGDMAKKKVSATPTIFVDGKEIDRNNDYFNVESFTKAVIKK